MEVPTELVGAHRLSQTLNQQLGNRHGDLSPLHVADSCVAFSLCGVPSSGTRTVAKAQAVSLEPVFYSGMPSPTLMPGGGACSCCNFIYHVLLIPMGGLNPSEGRWRSNEQKGGGGRTKEERREEKLWWVCKINFKNLKKIKKIIQVNLSPSYTQYMQVMPSV